MCFFEGQADRSGILFDGFIQRSGIRGMALAGEW